MTIKSSAGAGQTTKSNRTLWIVLIVLVLILVGCICSGALAWTFGDAFMEMLRSIR